jgi:Ras-related protein Rab-7A
MVCGETCGCGSRVVVVLFTNRAPSEMASSIVKIIVVGESSVGKTSMIHQFVNRTFTADFKSTIGSDFSAKPVTVDDTIVNLQIWDTAGQERYRSLSTSYFKGCEAAVIVFDLTSAHSFDRVNHWYDEVRRSCNLTPADLNGPALFPIFVVGNKSDLEDQRAVAKRDVYQFCKERHWEYVECSAKYGEGIDQLFKTVAVKVVDRRNKAPDVARPASVGRGGPASGRRGVQPGAAQPQGQPAGKKQCCSKQ